MLVRDTGIEPVTSSVSGKRSPAELIAPDTTLRWRRESNPCARLCRPLPHHSATPPLGLMPPHLRADDGIRTRDPHLGKVMRYQLRYIRAPRTTRRPSRSTTLVDVSVPAQIPRCCRRVGTRVTHQTSRYTRPRAQKRWPVPPSPLSVPTVTTGAGDGQRPARTASKTALAIRAGSLERASLRRRSALGSSLLGLVAQRESVRLTRGRSLVRSQSGPPPIITGQRPTSPPA